MSLSDEKKWELTLNLLTIVPAIVKAIPGAIDLYNKMIDAAKNGITPEEESDMLLERDTVLAKLVADTEAD